MIESHLSGNPSSPVTDRLLDCENSFVSQKEYQVPSANSASFIIEGTVTESYVAVGAVKNFFVR